MSDDEKKKKIGGIEKTRKSTSVQQVEGVEDVEKVKGVTKVGKVGKAGKAGDSLEDRALTYGSREQLMNMIDEEAAKLFGKSKIPAGQKEIIQKAVKMAIDAAIVPEDGDEDEEKGEEEK